MSFRHLLLSVHCSHRTFLLLIVIFAFFFIALPTPKLFWVSCDLECSSCILPWFMLSLDIFLLCIAHWVQRSRNSPAFIDICSLARSRFTRRKTINKYILFLSRVPGFEPETPVKLGPLVSPAEPLGRHGSTLEGYNMVQAHEGLGSGTLQFSVAPRIRRGSKTPPS